MMRRLSPEVKTIDRRVICGKLFLVAIDPELTSLIKAKFFVGAIGRGLADPPGARFPGHPQ